MRTWVRVFGKTSEPTHFVRQNPICDFRFMNRSLLFLASLAVMAIAPSTQALQFGFTIDFGLGPLAGTSAQGQFETTAGDGLKNFDNGGLLSFTFTVSGEVFDATYDASYPDFPVVEIIGGNTVGGLDYLSFDGPDGGILYLTFSPSSSVSFATYLPSGGNPFTDLSYGEFRSAPTQIDVPDSGMTGLCLASAAAGLGLLRRRNQRP